MAAQILELSRPTVPTVIADVGGGTGLFAVELLRQLDDHAEVLVVDPSREMLAQAPSASNLTTLCAPAETTRQALTRHGRGEVDLVLIKEAVHHFSNAAATLSDLSLLVKPGGSLLVVMLPTRIEYPLFDAALAHFAELQPDPAEIASYLAAGGLAVERQMRGFDLHIRREQWLTMVANRFMSLLSDFDDDELARGLAEVTEKLADHDDVQFTDRFEFVLGRKAG